MSPALPFTAALSFKVRAVPRLRVLLFGETKGSFVYSYKKDSFLRAYAAALHIDRRRLAITEVEDSARGVFPARIRLTVAVACRSRTAVDDILKTLLLDSSSSSSSSGSSSGDDDDATTNKHASFEKTLEQWLGYYGFSLNGGGKDGQVVHQLPVSIQVSGLYL
jgi:hypothetical protein